MNKKNTIENINSKLKEAKICCVYAKEIDYNFFADWKCLVCSHCWSSVIKHILYKKECPNCKKILIRKNKINNIKNFSEQYNIKCISELYKNALVPLEFNCQKCNYSFLTRWEHFKNNKTKCPRCAGKAKRGIEDAREKAESMGGKCLSDNYENSWNKLVWQCKNGHIWEASFSSVFYENTWCRRCYVEESLCNNKEFEPNTSRQQRWLHEVIGGSLNYPIFGYYIDIVMDCNKIAIEYDGSGHDLAVKIGRMTKTQWENYEKLRFKRIS